MASSDAQTFSSRGPWSIFAHAALGYKPLALL